MFFSRPLLTESSRQSFDPTSDATSRYPIHLRSGTSTSLGYRRAVPGCSLETQPAALAVESSTRLPRRRITILFAWESASSLYAFVSEQPESLLWGSCSAKLWHRVSNRPEPGRHVSPRREDDR